MPRYAVYQQHSPIDTKRTDKDGTPIFKSNLKLVREIVASGPSDAMKLAKQLPPFKYGTGRLRFPVVENLNEKKSREDSFARRMLTAVVDGRMFNN